MKFMPVLAVAGILTAGLLGTVATATAAPVFTKAVAGSVNAPVTQVRYGKHHRGHFRGHRGFTKSFKFYSPSHFYRHRGVKRHHGFKSHRGSFRHHGFHRSHRFGGFHKRGFSRH